MEHHNRAAEAVDKMFANDHFSHWLGINIISAQPGRCELQMTVRKEMLNGFEILHGGVSYSLADSALAFASNSYGKLSVALEVSMSYPAAAREGDILTAEAEELSLTNKIGVYLIKVTNQDQKQIGIFKGTVYRTSKSLLDN